MFLLVKNASIYAPRSMGIFDVLVAGSVIAAISHHIDASSIPGNVVVVEADGAPLVPGFIDAHVHVSGGGGEGGYSTRTPELSVSTCFRAGVTTVVGTLGTDGLSRSMENLVAKTYALREEGLSAWCFTGSYRVPPRTVTGDAMKDIMMIDPVIGIGEVAISDHRSSLPSLSELGRIASEARVGGMLSGKAGIVNVHIGDAPGALGPLEEITKSGEIPRTQFLPTHCNRSESTFRSALLWAKGGGFIDLTTSSVPCFVEEGELGIAAALKRFRDAGISLDNVSCTSDGQGSLPRFDGNGTFSGLGLGTSASLWESLRQAILVEGFSLEETLKPVTTTPASILKLRNKGRIAVGADADFLILDPVDYTVRTTIALGKVALEGGVLAMKGRFED